MASTWTTTNKQKLTWGAAPSPQSEASGVAYELLIGDTYNLDIGSGFVLQIQPENPPTNWTTTTKDKLSWPAPVLAATYQLEIGSGFLLEIGSGYNLTVGTNQRNETPWTKITKTGR